MYQWSIAKIVLELNWIKPFTNISNAVLKPSCNVDIFILKCSPYSWKPPNRKKQVIFCQIKFRLSIFIFSYLGFLFQSTDMRHVPPRHSLVHQISLFLLDWVASIIANMSSHSKCKSTYLKFKMSSFFTLVLLYSNFVTLINLILQTEELIWNIFMSDKQFGEHE